LNFGNRAEKRHEMSKKVKEDISIDKEILRCINKDGSRLIKELR